MRYPSLPDHVFSDNQGNTIQNVADPVENQDVATKSWTLSQVPRLKRATGTLQAYTDPGSPEAGPPNVVYFIGSTFGKFSLTLNGSTVTFTVAIADPEDGSIWINSNSFSSTGEVANAMTNAFNGSGISGISVSNNSNTVTVVCNLTGSTQSMSATGDSNISVISNGGVGTDYVAPSGATTEIILVTPITGAQIKTVRCSFAGSIGGGTTVALYLKDEANSYMLLSSEEPANSSGLFKPYLLSIAAWSAGGSSGESLYVELYGGTLPVDSSTCTVEIVYEQY